MKFLESFKKFQKELTLEKFKESYLKITKFAYNSSFCPPDSILEKYFEFIKNLDNKYNNNYLSVVVAPRESFKTTTFSVILPLMLIFNSLKNNDDLTTIVLGSFSLERVITAIYKPIQLALTESFDIITSNARHTIIKKGDKEFALFPIHINSTLRSINWKGKRPNLIILDDIDQPAYIQGITARINSVSRFSGDWLPSIENGNSFILIAGNIEHKISIIKDLLSEDKDYVNKLVLPCKVDGKYIRPEWNEKWEETQRKQLKDDFDRLYYHTLKSDIFEFIKNNKPIGIKQVFIDFGTAENSMVAVFFVGDTIVNIIKTDYLGINEIIEEILAFKPNYIFYERNANQGNIFRSILEPKLHYFNLIPFFTTTHKQDRIGVAINMLLEGKVKVIPSLEEEIKEEIEIFKEEGNSHVLDMVGVYCERYIANNPEGRLTWSA